MPILPKHGIGESRNRIRPSALRGAARLMDWGGSFREDTARILLERRAKRKTAAEALAGDWERVGRDLQNAMNRYEAEVHEAV